MLLVMLTLLDWWARTSINQYPWFSPAGASRGALNNAVKLAYNPSQAQRDTLYPKRINPIIFSPGAGIILFGDKTALSYTSAFDRINVRRLFLTLESSIERAARAQLFEFNDTITRANFINIVEPYLRDVKSKRGITDFVVVCDESNNTPDVIDGNQFKAISTSNPQDQSTLLDWLLLLLAQELVLKKLSVLLNQRGKN